ncbi:putative lipoprotein [Streptomyces chromofuscus]|nr:putative lipoprotein [Streptomyces chromofuscus]
MGGRMQTTILRRGVRRVAVALAAVVALTGGLAGCTAADPSGRSAEEDRPSRESAARLAPIAALRSAERSTDLADSARVQSTTTMGTLMSMTADGVLGWSDGITGTLTITYTGGTMADTMRRLGSTSMEARYLPDAYYARMGDAFAEQAGGRHWLRYGYDDLAELAGGSGAYLQEQMRNTTPKQSVELLLASGDVKEVGTEDVRGERTTHYSGTVDVADLATHNSHLSADRLADLRRQLERAGVTTQTVDIWVNDRDLLVKKVEQGRMATGELTQTAYYSDYGAEVSAERPPADDTRDFRELMSAGGGSS